MKLPLHTNSMRQEEKRPSQLSWLSWLSRLGLALGLSLLFSSGPAMAALPNGTVRNIVLVHGAFADGSNWSSVIKQLTAMGYYVTAVQNPMTSLQDDVLATQRVLRRQKGDVLLVGHSWAGTVITQAGNASNVKGLVYLSALVPDSGESAAGLLQRLNAPMTGLTPDEEGWLWLDDPAQFHLVMAADLPMKKAQLLASVQQPIAAACFAEKIQHAAWHDKPSWYLQTTDDKALLPSVQRAIAKQIGAQTLSIRSSHLSLVSHPDTVAKFIDHAAREAGR
ncbi:MULTISPECIES: alpha/beta hydrolase [Pseudomonas syringae group]|uniref:alpha/beta hydrolase n=1 Tax=Pseudomonas syringae group TaxID=136849 RepID=UPI001C57E51D|nr:MULTISPECIES: alpha/beta hydrolase [Pseudomonas syringae group]MDU8457305.1 alpha/beta hydrolase [Pseudomonas syringae group sp. J254-4]QXW43051.1 alpha/beta hydrolase [Pseudomonas amygdali]